MPQKILACVAYDEGTDTCTTQAWIDQPALLPSLTVADAQTIGVAFALLWATAYIFKLMRKVLET
jgi:hypothetical protein